jgi:putative endonuclease
MRLAKLRAQIRDKKWYVYILECRDGSYYCGITNNLEKRISSHNNGTGAKYTRGRRPVRLLEAVKFSSRGEALQVEAAVKKQQRAKKIDFLKSKGFIDK